MPPQQDSIGSLARVLSQQIDINRLPPPEPGIFSGNPLEYQSWKMSFDLLIDQSLIAPVEKLHYLRRYVTGEAKECIDGYLLEASDASYHDAKLRLEQRFGDPIIIADAYRKRLGEWPKVKTGSDLLLLSDYLKQLESAMKTNSYLSILNDCMENQKILMKLPDWVVTRWSRIVQQNRSSRVYPGFSAFSEFIAQEAKVASDPIASIQALRAINNDTNDSKPKDTSKASKKVKSKSLNTCSQETQETRKSDNNSKPTENSLIRHTNLILRKHLTRFPLRHRVATKSTIKRLAAGIATFVVNNTSSLGVKNFASLHQRHDSISPGWSDVLQVPGQGAQHRRLSKDYDNLCGLP